MIISIVYINDRPVVRARDNFLEINKLFFTADIVTDYKEARQFAHEQSFHVSISSSVDEFVEEHSDEYEWSDNDMIVRKETR